MPAANEIYVGKVLSPSKLAHVVLHTNQYEAMVDYYSKFLGGRCVYSDNVLSFITYDDEHHRIAIAALPGTTDKVPHSSGLAHIAFTYDTLQDMATSYSQRKALGVLPFWCVNHGTTTSIYYHDPDGNELETQVDNFDSAEEVTEFMLSPLFRENPVGTDFSPEDLIFRLQSGEETASIKKRVEIGSRHLPGPRGIPPPQLVKAS